MAGTESVNPMQPQAERPGPPMPKAVFRLVNPVMKMILWSPLHGLMSNDLMILSFAGRKSGKRYSTPVGYIQQGDRLYLFTHSGWWKNLRGGAPVSVRLRGKTVEGQAGEIQDPQRIAEIARLVIAKRGRERAERMGIGEPPHPATKFIEVRLKGE